MATHTDNYTLGRGEVWFRKSGETTYRFLGNAPTFNLNVNAEKLEHNSSRGGVAELDMSITTKVTRMASLTLEDINHENIALAMLGSVATLTQTGVTAATYSVVVKKGGLVQVGETAGNPTGVRKLSNVVVKKGTTTAVAGTDYVLDADRGTIEVLESGTLFADGDTMGVTYDTATVSRKQTIAGSTQVTGELKYLANNPQGSNIDYYAPKVVLQPNGDIALISDNALQNIQMQIAVLKSGALAAVYADGAPYVAS